MTRYFSFPCPACKAAGQRYPRVAGLLKVARTRCTRCGVALHSDLGMWRLIYAAVVAQLAIYVVAIPIALEMTVGHWWLRVGLLVLFAAAGWPLGLFMHARRTTVGNGDTRWRLYTRDR